MRSWKLTGSWSSTAQQYNQRKEQHGDVERTGDALNSKVRGWIASRRVAANYPQKTGGGPTFWQLGEKDRGAEFSNAKAAVMSKSLFDQLDPIFSDSPAVAPKETLSLGAKSQIRHRGVDLRLR